LLKSQVREENPGRQSAETKGYRVAKEPGLNSFGSISGKKTEDGDKASGDSRQKTFKSKEGRIVKHTNNTNRTYSGRLGHFVWGGGTGEEAKPSEMLKKRDLPRPRKEEKKHWGGWLVMGGGDSNLSVVPIEVVQGGGRKQKAAQLAKKG